MSEHTLFTKFIELKPGDVVYDARADQLRVVLAVADTHYTSEGWTPPGHSVDIKMLTLDNNEPSRAWRWAYTEEMERSRWFVVARV